MTAYEIKNALRARRLSILALGVALLLIVPLGFVVDTAARTLGFVLLGTGYLVANIAIARYERGRIRNESASSRND
jgi:hypothetical protein